MRASRLLLMAFIVLGLLSVAVASYLLLPVNDDEILGEEKLHGWLVDEPERAPNFTLTDQNGEKFTLSDVGGSVSLLFFGYSHCPDACPTTLIKYRWVQERLGEDRDRVNFIFITVDPERDDPETLRSYIETVGIDMKYLTGDVNDLQPVWESYGIYIEKYPLSEVEGNLSDQASDDDYLVDHTAMIYVIDTELNLRETFTLYDPSEDLLADVKFLLGE